MCNSALHLPYEFVIHRAAKFLDLCPDALHKEVHSLDIEVEKFYLLGRNYENEVAI